MIKQKSIIVIYNATYCENLIVNLTSTRNNILIKFYYLFYY